MGVYPRPLHQRSREPARMSIVRRFLVAMAIAAVLGCGPGDPTELDGRHAYEWYLRSGFRDGRVEMVDFRQLRGERLKTPDALFYRLEYQVTVRYPYGFCSGPGSAEQTCWLAKPRPPGALATFDGRVLFRYFPDRGRRWLVHDVGKDAMP